MAGLVLGFAGVGMACSGGGAERSERSPVAVAEHSTLSPDLALATLKQAWPEAWVEVGAGLEASLGQGLTTCGDRLVVATRSAGRGPWELRAIPLSGRSAGPASVVALPPELGDIAFVERVGQEGCRVAVGWNGASDSGLGAADIDGGWTPWSLPPSAFLTSEARWSGGRLLVGVVARAADRSLRAGVAGIAGDRWSWELVPDADGLLGPSVSFALDGAGLWVGAAGTGPQGGGALGRVAREAGLEVLFSGSWLQEAASAVRSVAGYVIVGSPGAPGTGAAEGRIDVFRVEGGGLVLHHTLVGSELEERLGQLIEVGVDAGGPLVAATARRASEVRLYRLVDGVLVLRTSVPLPQNASRLPVVRLADLDRSGTLDAVVGTPGFGPDGSELGAVVVHFDPAPAPPPDEAATPPDEAAPPPDDP